MKISPLALTAPAALGCAHPSPRAGSRRPRTAAARTAPSPARRRPSPRTARPGRPRGGRAPAGRERPWQRSTAHSFRARNRRPSAGPYSLSDSASSASGVRRYSGIRLKAARRSSGRRVHSSEQSIGVSIHLWALTTSESARSTPGERPAVLGADHRRARVGGVDVQPRRRSARRHRRARAPDRPPWSPSCRRSPRPQPPPRGRPAPRAQPELGVAADLAQRMPSIRAALSRPRNAPARSTRSSLASGGLAGGDQRRQRRGRGAVLDVAVPAGRQPEQLGDPVEHHALELGRRRRRAPQDRDRVERRRQQLGEDRRLGRAGGEVREVARVLPVRDAREQHLVEVAQHRRERLGLVGRAGRQARPGSRPARPARAPAARATALQVAGRPLERRRLAVQARAEVRPSSARQPRRRPGTRSRTPVSSSETSHSRRHASSS